MRLTQTESAYPTLDQQFKLIQMPLVDAAGKALTGQKLSIRLSAAANGANYRLDDLTLSGKKIIVNAQSVAVTTAGNVPALLSKGTTLQLLANVLPDNTTYKSVSWTLAAGADKATISPDGLLTATANGMVTVRATAKYTPGIFGELVVKITDIIPGRTFVISARHSGKALSVRSGQTKDGIDVKQLTYSGESNQQWKLEAAGNGAYTLTAMHSGKALSVVKGSTKEGEKVEQAAYNAQAYQQWKIEEADGGYYKLTAMHSGQVLSVSKGDIADETPVRQNAYTGAAFQQWKFDSVPGGARMVASAEATPENEAVRVYPNPTKGAFQVSLEGFAQDNGTLKILTPTGQVLYQQSIGQESLVTVRHPLPAGMYLVQVTGSKGVITRKLVVR